MDAYSFCVSIIFCKRVYPQNTYRKSKDMQDMSLIIGTYRYIKRGTFMCESDCW